MDLTAQITRTVLATLILCLAANLARAQVTQTKEGGSTIHGTVVYADTGRPLRSAGIALIPDIGEIEYTTASDRRGQFVIPNVPAGRYVVLLFALGILEPENYKRRTGPIIPQLKLSERNELYTEVNVNGTDSVEVKVQAVRGGVITGRVLTEDDQPLAGADIKLLRRENEKWVPVSKSWSHRDRNLQVLTDPTGAYRLAGLRAGEYLVRAAEPSLDEDRIGGADDAYANGSFMAAYHPSATNLKEAQVVTVVEGSEATGVDIRMPERASHTLAVTVTFGPTKEPARTQVVIERKEEAGFVPAGTGLAWSWTDVEGKWNVVGLPRGEYLVSIGGTSVRVGNDRYVNTTNKQAVVRIQEEAVTELNVNLSPGALFHGKVIDLPASEAYKLLLQLLPVDDRSDKAGNDVNYPSSHSATVQQGGDFIIAGVASGNYWFVTMPDSTDYYIKSVTRKGVDLMQTPVKLVAGESFGDVVVTIATDVARVEAQLKLPEGAIKKSFADMLVIMAPANDVTRRFSRGRRILQPDAEGRITFNSAPGEYFITVLTPNQIKKQGAPGDKYFEKDTEKFHRLKLRSGERVKGLTLTVADK